MTREIEWTAADGTRLFARLHGEETAAAPGVRPVVCLPGLTRNSRDFEGVADALAHAPGRPRAVLAMDFRGRGRSGYADPATYRADVEAADVVAGLDAMGWTTPAYIGTSRGGIVTMILAATAPERVGPVVLNDIGPVIAIEGLVAIRDRMAAMLSARPESWDAAIADLEATMGRAFTALRPEDWSRFARRIYREDEAGRPVLDYDPRLLEAFAAFDPAVGYPPLWPVFDALKPRPVLTIRGEASDLLDETTLAEMAARMPAMQIHRVPGEGHAPLLDDAPTVARIRRFLDETDDAA